MRHDLGAALQETIDREAPYLYQITEEDAGTKPPLPGWSKKEELGHLIDSAANNHVRFVNASLQPDFRGLSYAQNDWVARHGYQEMPWTGIVDFWRAYNQFLAGLVRRIPEDSLQTSCVIGDGPAVTLEFVIQDYIVHMQHHIDHILRREKITQYPQAAVTAAAR